MTDMVKVNCSDECHLLLVINLNRLKNVDYTTLLLSPKRIGRRDFPETCVLIAKNVETRTKRIKKLGPEEYGLVRPESALEKWVNLLSGERNNGLAHFKNCKNC